MSNVVVIIQARMGSKRLPGKVMADIAGQPMLWHVWDRVRRADRIDGVIIATCADMCQFIEGPLYYIGSENDVLKRFADCAVRYKTDTIVRITADCPLIDPIIIDRMIEIHHYHKSEFTTNVEPPSWPDGMDIEIFSRAKLLDAHFNAKLPSEREHVTTYMKREGSILNCRKWPDLSGYRWTVDEQRDLDFVRAVYSEIGRHDFGMRDVLELLERRPDLAALNAGIRRNEGMEKSVRKDTNV